MRLRVTTALIGIPLVLLLLAAPAPFALFALGVLALLAGSEFLRLLKQHQPRQLAILAAGVWFLLGLAYLLPPLGFLMLAIALFLIGGLWFKSGIGGRWWIGGLIYLGLPLGTMVSLRLIEDGQRWFLIFLLGTWLTDTFAMFGGKAFGRTKLSPISPNKTREGTAIGIIGGGIAIILIAAALGLWDWEKSAGAIILAAFLLPSAAVAGDLLESKLKRNANVKDSGKLFPGHGGMLDRIDSLLFTAPLLWFLLLLFGLI